MREAVRPLCVRGCVLEVNIHTAVVVVLMVSLIMEGENTGDVYGVR